MPIGVLTLRFQDEDLEAAFAGSYAKRSRGLARLALLLGFTLYALFGTLDPWMVPEATRTIWLIRACVCLFLLLVYGITFHGSFTRHMQAWMSMVVLGAGAGILGMVLIAEAAGGYYYYAGLMLVFMYAHGLLRMRFVYATLTSFVVFAAYEAIAIGLKSTPVPVVVNNTFFLVSAILMGMCASYALELYMRKIFWQNRMLDEKRRQLDAEHVRKTQELEAARQLQLAMVPKHAPGHPALDLAAAMKPATEIGGDYYDFNVAGDGTLTFVIGDATGHGAQAGTMVTATKILFTGLSEERDLVEMLRKANGILKRVGLSKVYMALALGQFRNGTLELVGAGMPPALVYRAASGQVKEIPLKGAPLGSFVDFPYRTTRVELAPGDTVLLMSDGFPELFNLGGEMLGYEQAVTIFREAAHGSPEEIIRYFEQTARHWMGDCMPNDDVTFVVLKMKPYVEHHSTVSKEQVAGLLTHAAYASDGRYGETDQPLHSSPAAFSRRGIR